jgi:hypothetical protein
MTIEEIKHLRPSWGYDHLKHNGFADSIMPGHSSKRRPTSHGYELAYAMGERGADI